jgi:hypothetical protein
MRWNRELRADHLASGREVTVATITFNSPEERKGVYKLTNFIYVQFYYFTMAANNQELRSCLDRIGWNEAQKVAIIAEGFSDLEDLGEVVLKDVSHIYSTISKLACNRGGVRIGYPLVRRFKGLIWWVKDHHPRDQVPDEADWSLEVCKDAIDFMDMEEAQADDEGKIEPPGILKESDWVQWEIKLINFLQNMLGKKAVPLHYIIRKDLPASHVFAKRCRSLGPCLSLARTSLQRRQKTTVRFLA